MIFVAVTLLLAIIFESQKIDGQYAVSWHHLVLCGIVIITGLVVFIFEIQLLGWLFLISYYAFLLSISSAYADLNVWRKSIIVITLSLMAGFVPVLINQIIIKFSDEEFYAALSGLAFSIFWLILWVVYEKFLRRLKIINKLSISRHNKLTANRILLVTAALTILLVIWSGWSYKRSFFPHEEAELFSGISSETPFICGETNSNPEVNINIKNIQDRFAMLLAEKDDLSINDYAFLAILNEDEHYAKIYREQLLAAAENRLYTAPANSVKFDQYLASQTIYYYEEIIKKFPSLFTEHEFDIIKTWFYQINERAQTIEWIDWLYGFAFSLKPVGAYENQEIGAGLYAQLLENNLSKPSLLEKNQKYLDADSRGWVNGFRVLDDAITYQPIWITNAFLQSLYDDRSITQNQRLSFEWLLLQSLPDVNIIGYNFPSKTSAASVSLLGARLLDDGRFLWLANRAMDSLNDINYLYAQPGAEVRISDELIPETPQIGSCLLYGNAGLPGQKGSISPDKIVFREGWEPDDLYILLNLRFTGWHRYKALNAISIIYKGGNLVEEQNSLNPITWLPIGRAMVRDKRISIEQLNTLLIPRQGLDAVLNTLIDWFGTYSQDPPFYAAVEAFETSTILDFSRSVIDDWHGWHFERSIYFYHDGPVFILDEAITDKRQKAAISWHLAEGSQVINNFRVKNEDIEVDMLLIGQEDGALLYETEENGLLLQYQSPKIGNLQLVTVLLPGNWQEAELVELTQNDMVSTIKIILEGKEYLFDLGYDYAVVKIRE